MSRIMMGRKTWLIPLCILMAGMASLYGWQQLNAQDSAPGVAASAGTPDGTPAAGAAPGAAGAPGDAALTLNAVVPGNIKIMSIKNWDGKSTNLLRFKYRTLDKRVITVHLPASYKTDKKSRDGWDTLFQCYAMDVEAGVQIADQRNNTAIADAVGKAIAQSQAANNNADSAGNVAAAAAAADMAKNSLPSIIGASQLPPLFPGL